MSQFSTKPATRIPKFRTRFFTPIKRIVENLGPAFDRYGDVLELTGFPVRIFCLRDPQHIEQLLKHPEVGTTKHVAMLPRVKWVMRSGGYILRGGAEWRERRLQVQAAFRRPRLLQYASEVPAAVQPFLDNWDAASRDGVSFNILPDLQRLITQLNFKMFFSTHLGESALEDVRKKTHFIEMNFVRGTPLWLPSPSNVRFRHFAISLRQTMLELIADRRANPKSHEDVLSTLLEINEPKPLTDAEIVDEVFSIFFGASVMSTTLAWCLYLVGTHGEAQDQLMAEVHQVLGHRPPTVDDLEALPCATMTLQEAMRLYPPSWGYPRYCEAGMPLGEYEIPPRTMIIPVVYQTHRCQKYWDEPEEFRPDRFSDDSKANRHPFAYLPFGAGSRICLGAQLAPMVMIQVLAMIVQRYRLSHSPRFSSDPIADFGFEIHPRDEIRMTITAHSSGSAT